MLVVDDGSSDATAARAAGVAAPGRRVRVVSHPRNRGYGAALRTGFDAATCDAVFHHGQRRPVRPVEISRLLALYGPDRVVSGYRIRRSDTFLRRLYHKRVLRPRALRFGPTVRDVNCAFKLFPRAVGQGLHADGALVCTELLVRARRSGYRLMNVGVHHYPRTTGRATGADVRVVLRAFRELWQLRTHPAVARRARTARVSSGRQRRRGAPRSPPSRLSRLLWLGVFVAVLAIDFPGTPLLTGLHNHLVAWDAISYLSIAAHGYPAHLDYRDAFLPGFPLLVRAVAVIIRDDVVASWLVNAVAETIALWYLARLVLARARPVVGDLLGVAARAGADGALPHRAVQREHLHRGRRGEPVLRARRTVAQGDRRRRARVRLPAHRARADPGAGARATAAHADGGRARTCCSSCSLRSPLALYAAVHADPHRRRPGAARRRPAAVVRPAAHAAVDRVRRHVAHAHQRHRRGDALDLRPRGRLRAARAACSASACGYRRGSPDRFALYCTIAWLMTASLPFWRSQPRYSLALFPAVLLVADLTQRVPRARPVMLGASAVLMCAGTWVFAQGRWLG